MAFLTDALKKSIKNVIGIDDESSVSPVKNKGGLGEESSIHLKIISKNFMDFSGMARDLNVASQNVQELVRIMGGQAREKEDMFLLKEDEKERKLKVEVDKLKPTPVEDEEKKKPSLISKLAGKGFEKFKKTKLGKKTMKGVKKLSDMKKQFSDSAFMKSFKKYFALAAIIGIIFVAFKDTFIEWASSLWETIKKSFNDFVGKIKEWFNEIVQPIIDKVMEFLQPFIDVITKTFEKISNFFAGYIKQIRDFFEPVVEFVSKIWNKFMVMIDDFKEWLKPKVEKMLNYKATAWLIPEWLKTWLKIGEKPAQVSKEEQDVENKKLQRQQKEAVDTERVKKQEEKAKYKDEDEIVRKRHGIEDKTMTMRAEEKKKTEVPAAAAPTPSPTPTKGEEKKEIKKPASPGFEAGKKEMLAAMDKEGIKNPDQRAQIIAQTAHESGKYKYTQELGNEKYFQKYEGRKDLGNVNPGDGIKYIGRGFLQTTGRVNYQQFKDAYNVDVINSPEKLAEPKFAAESALFWFRKNAKKVEKMSGGDWSNTKGITKAVNGGYNGLDERMQYFEMFRKDPEIVGVTAASSSPSGGGVSTASSDVASGQRQQQKPSTPNVINAPTNNTTVTKNTQVAATPQKDTSQLLTSRAT